MSDFFWISSNCFLEYSLSWFKLVNFFSDSIVMLNNSLTISFLSLSHKTLKYYGDSDG